MICQEIFLVVIMEEGMPLRSNRQKLGVLLSMRQHTRHPHDKELRIPSLEIKEGEKKENSRHVSCTL